MINNKLLMTLAVVALATTVLGSNADQDLYDNYEAFGRLGRHLLTCRAYDASCSSSSPCCEGLDCCWVNGSRKCKYCCGDSDCIDGNRCTTDTCNPAEGCSSVPVSFNTWTNPFANLASRNNPHHLPNTMCRRIAMMTMSVRQIHADHQMAHACIQQ